MKNRFMYFSPYFIIGTFCVFVFFSCTSNPGIDLNIDQESESKTKIISDYFHVGEIHNDYLSYANEIYSKHDLFSLSDSERDMAKLSLLKGFQPSSSYGQRQHIYDGLFDNDKSNNSMINLLKGDFYEHNKNAMVTAMNALINKEMMASVEKELILELFDYIFESASNTEDVLKKVEELSVQWTNTGFPQDGFKGTLSAYTLAIAKYSFNFWDENAEAIKNIHNISPDSKFWWIVATIAAKDVAGGLAGILVNEAYEDLIIGDTSETTEDEIIQDFVTGAITGSVL